MAFTREQRKVWRKSPSVRAKQREHKRRHKEKYPRKFLAPKIRRIQRGFQKRLQEKQKRGLEKERADFLCIFAPFIEQWKNDRRRYMARFGKWTEGIRFRLQMCSWGHWSLAKNCNLRLISKKSHGGRNKIVVRQKEFDSWVSWSRHHGLTRVGWKKHKKFGCMGNGRFESNDWNILSIETRNGLVRFGRWTNPETWKRYRSFCDVLEIIHKQNIIAKRQQRSAGWHKWAKSKKATLYSRSRLDGNCRDRKRTVCKGSISRVQMRFDWN